MKTGEGQSIYRWVRGKKKTSVGLFAVRSHYYTPWASQKRWSGNTELFLSLQDLGISQRNNDAAGWKQTTKASHKAEKRLKKQLEQILEEKKVIVSTKGRHNFYLWKPCWRTDTGVTPKWPQIQQICQCWEQSLCTCTGSGRDWATALPIPSPNAVATRIPHKSRGWRHASFYPLDVFKKQEVIDSLPGHRELFESPPIPQGFLSLFQGMSLLEAFPV